MAELGGAEMKLVIDRQSRGAIIHIRGELDAYSAPALEKAVSGLLSDGTENLVFDLARTSFVYSAGLRVMLNTQRQCAAGTRTLALRAPSQAVQRLLTVTGLDEQFAIET